MKTFRKCHIHNINLKTKDNITYIILQLNAKYEIRIHINMYYTAYILYR